MADEELRFFASAVEFRRWLRKNHAKASALWVGFWKKGSGRPSITYEESVEQALCFGWIDGVRYTIDDVSYKMRFTPRKPRSNWSQVNVRRVEALERAGLMTDAGRAAFALRDEARDATYGYENRSAARLTAAQQRLFRSNRRAWAWFQGQPTGYRQTAIWWVGQAKQEATRERRLARLIDDSAQGRRIRELTRPGERR